MARLTGILRQRLHHLDKVTGSRPSTDCWPVYIVFLFVVVSRVDRAYLVDSTTPDQSKDWPRNAKSF